MTPPRHPGKGLVYALLVGIDAYSPPVPPLTGCGNDIDDLADFLRTLLGDRLRLLILRDASATTGGVRDAFRDHLARAGPGDAALFCFSGHGSQAPVAEKYWHLEPTGMHQTLVCADSRHGADDLTDKELSVLLDTVAARGAHVAVVLDCCHSGGGTREAHVRVRGIPAATKAPAGTAYAAALERIGTAGRMAETGPTAGPHIALSACRSFETAKELTVGGTTRGVFTASLLAVLRSLGPYATYRALHMAARNHVQDQVREQTPVLFPLLPDGIADEPFLGGAIVRASAFTLGHSMGRWRVDAGACHGIPPSGDGQVVLAVSAEDPDSAGRRVVVTEVRPGDCDVRPVGWTPDPGRGYPVLVAERPVPLVDVEVSGRSDDDPAAIAMVRTALAELEGHSAINVVEAPADTGTNPPRPRLRVAASRVDGHPVLAIVRGDGSPAAKPVPGHGPNSARTVAAQIDHIARWSLIKGAEAPGSPVDGLVTVEFVAAAPHETLAPRTGRAISPNEAGEIELAYRHTAEGWRAPEVFIRIHNGSGLRLWCALLDLTDRYRCHAGLFPGDFVAPWRTAVAVDGRPVPITLPPGRDVKPGAVVRDWCKLIVSDTEINTPAFDLPPIEETYAHAARHGDVRNLFARRLRDIGPPRNGSLGGWWATSITPVVTRVPES